MIDLPIHKGKRKRLVETLISKGITDKKVLNAILNIPRHFFMDSDFQSFAYDDKAFPILSNQTISQPYTVALQTELLKIKSSEINLRFVFFKSSICIWFSYGLTVT